MEIRLDDKLTESTVDNYGKQIMETTLLDQICLNITDVLKMLQETKFMLKDSSNPRNLVLTWLFTIQ